MPFDETLEGETMAMWTAPTTEPDRAQWLAEKLDRLGADLGFDEKDTLVWLVEKGLVALYGGTGVEDIADAVAGHNKLTEKQRRFLLELDRCSGQMSRACAALGMSMNTPYNWRARSSEFADAYSAIIKKHAWKSKPGRRPQA